MSLVQTTLHSGVLTVTLHRPKAYNALNAELLTALLETVEQHRNDPAVRVWLFRGEGRAFVAGADIREMSAMDPEQARQYGALGHRVMTAVDTLPQVTLAAVHGAALGGGCELMLCCDMVLAREGTMLGLPEVGLGLIPGFGGTQRLARRIGWGRARAWLLTGETLPAENALAAGLVDQVFAKGAFDTSVEELASRVAARSAHAIATAKACLADSQPNLEPGLERESQNFAQLFSHKDAKEGLTAFQEKRPPKF